LSGNVQRTLTAVSAVGAGTAGGVFFAFSTFVMAGLDRLAPAASIEAMQAINAAAPSAWFMSVLFGTALLAAGLALWSAFHLDETAAMLRLVGGGIYLVSIVLTIGYHVPRNEALDRVDPGSSEAGARWASYVSGWTAWNHVRTLSAIAACALFVAAVWTD
jgi:uncharacterized membrane protein